MIRVVVLMVFAFYALSPLCYFLPSGPKVRSAQKRRDAVPLTKGIVWMSFCLEALADRFSMDDAAEADEDRDSVMIRKKRTVHREHPDLRPCSGTALTHPEQEKPDLVALREFIVPINPHMKESYGYRFLATGTSPPPHLV